MQPGFEPTSHHGYLTEEAGLNHSAILPSLWMDIGGFCQEEFKMYMENPWRAPAIHPATEIKFVKPP